MFCCCSGSLLFHPSQVRLPTILSINHAPHTTIPALSIKVCFDCQFPISFVCHIFNHNRLSIHCQFLYHHSHTFLPDVNCLFLPNVFAHNAFFPFAYSAQTQRCLFKSNCYINYSAPKLCVQCAQLRLSLIESFCAFFFCHL